LQHKVIDQSNIPNKLENKKKLLILFYSKKRTIKLITLILSLHLCLQNSCLVKTLNSSSLLRKICTCLTSNYKFANTLSRTIAMMCISNTFYF